MAQLHSPVSWPFEHMHATAQASLSVFENLTAQFEPEVSSRWFSRWVLWVISSFFRDLHADERVWSPQGLNISVAKETRIVIVSGCWFFLLSRHVTWLKSVATAASGLWWSSRFVCGFYYFHIDLRRDFKPAKIPWKSIEKNAYLVVIPLFLWMMR